MSSVALALALAVIAGWLSGPTMLTAIVPGAISMKMNTAICVVAYAVSLLLLARWHGHRLIVGAVRVLSALAIAVALVTAAEWLFGFDSGLDQLIVRESPGALFTVYPGRMSFLSAVALTGIGLSVLLMSAGARPRLAAGSAWLATLVGGINVIGQFWGEQALTTGLYFTPTSVPASIAYVTLGGAALLLRSVIYPGIDRAEGLVDRTLERRMHIGIAAAVLLLTAVVGAAYRSTAEFSANAGLVTRSQEVRVSLARLGAGLRDLQVQTQAILLLRDKSTQLETAAGKINDELSRLGVLIPDDPGHQRRLKVLHDSAHRDIALVRSSLDARGAGAGGVATQPLLDEIESSIHETLDSLAEMDALEARLVEERTRATADRQDTSATARLLALALVSAIASILFVGFRREMRSRRVIELATACQHRALVLFASTSDRKETLDGFLELISDTLPFPVSAFYAYHEWGGRLTVEASVSLPADAPRVLRLGEGLAGRATQEGRRISYSGDGATGFRLETGVGARLVSEVLAFPVTYRDRRLGVLVVASSRPVSPTESELVEHLCGQLAIALNIHEQYDDLRRMADELSVKNDEVTRANQELESASRMKSEFLANMSHELRTPLNAIIGFSEAFIDGVLGEVSDEQRGFIQDIRSAGWHLLSLIDDILDLSKVEAGKMELELSSVTVGKLLQNVETMFKQRASSEGIDLIIERGADDIPIVADVRRLRQVIYNLVSNSLKFTPRGGSVRVSTGLDAPGAGGIPVQSLEIAVADSGVGIPVEDQERLFAPFIQLSASTSREHGGTGLGLALVKRLVELHGGHVGVESAPGEGSRFWVRIPIEGPPGAADQTRQDEPGAPLAPEKAPDAAPAVAKTVTPQDSALRQYEEAPLALVVEDDDDAAELIELHLHSQGITVHRAPDAESALAWLTENIPNLITLDLLLTGVDGWELLALLRKDARTESIPVIIITIVPERRLGISLGANRVLHKPVSWHKLTDTLIGLGAIAEPDSPPPRILIIDDDRSATDLLAMRMSLAGFEVSVAYDGATGVDQAKSEEPQVIILDLLMPGMSGFEVAARLREDPRTKDLPIIVLTAKILTQEDRRRLNGKVQSILEKSDFEPTVFTQEVRRVLISSVRGAPAPESEVEY